MNRHGRRRARAGGGADALAATMQQGLDHLRHGRLRPAIQCFRRVRARSPRHPDALHLLGIAELQAGDADAAVEALEAAVGVAPTAANVWLNLGVAHRTAGAVEPAIAALERAVELDPQSVDPVAMLADALVEAGHAERAVSLTRDFAAGAGGAKARVLHGGMLVEAGRPAEALDVLLPLVDESDDPELQYSVASAHDALGDHAAAAAAYARAVEAEPDFVEAWVGLGGCRAEIGDPRGAAHAYRRALALAPDMTEVQLALAGAERRAGDLDAAVETFEAVLARHPGRRDAAHDLAVAEAERGRVDRALAGFEAILAADPLDPAALHELVALGGTADDPAAWLERVEEAAAVEGLDPRGEALLHYAAGRLADRLDRTESAFDHWERANALQAEEEHFDPGAFAARVDGLISAFTPALFDSLRHAGDPDARPIFVVGVPRSGTTLVEQILASHPEVHGAGERPDMGRIVMGLPRECGGDYPDCVASLTPETARRLAARYLEAVYPPGDPGPRVVDKLPSNFLRLGVIALLFPNARVVDCARDPLDTGLSCFAQNFTEPQPFSHRLDWIAAYVAQKERLVRHWRDVLPAPVHRLDYEALVGDLEGETRALLEFCGLSWDDRCLEFFNTARPVQTASLTQVRRPIYASSVGRWRRYADRLAPLGRALAEAGLARWPA